MIKHVGRHRAAGYSSLAELSKIVGDTSNTAMRATALVAVSGGLIAGMVIPAHADTVNAGSDGLAVGEPAADRPIIDIAAALGQAGSGTTAVVPVAVAVVPEAFAAPAVAAPALGPVVTAPATALPSFGTLGFKPKKVTVAPVRASRSTSAPRTAPVASTSAPAAPAPARAVPAPSGSVLQVAAGLLGIPYRYGGTTPSGFDCSGFTGYVYKLARGIILPRTAENQRRGAVKISDPAPGDLVFFGIPATHVGIYAGNGMMYDSPHTGMSTSYRKIYSANVTYGRY
ncbi:MAG: C40 family peptidase [Actinomycetales bacterium]|nr:C40 family peptidase [Actinomycetales bacterium]